MKLNSLLVITAVMASCPITQAEQAATPHESDFRSPHKFAALAGMEVRNLQNEKLGTIKFVTLDVENGRIVEVAVTSGGGFLGFGAKTRAVPPRVLTFDESARVARLNVSKEKFEGAPRFDSSHMAASSSRERVAEVNRYFGLEPWFFVEGQKVVKNAQILRLGYISKLEDVLGLPITNTKGAYLGKVRSVITDLPKGQIAHIVATTEATSGPDKSVIQARELRYNKAHNGLVMDETMVELAGEPHFKWVGNNAFQEESYVNREVKADHGLHSKQNAKEGRVSKVSPMEQGENFRDEQKTSRIKQAIQADSSLSANAKDVEVVTLNSQTTLRGHVNTAEGKRKIGAIAEKAGRPENVSNLLEVRP